MAKMIEQKCSCGKIFSARTADVKRGWAKSCSKSCAATVREKITGNYARYQERKMNRPDEDEFFDELDDIDWNDGSGYGDHTENEPAIF